MSKDYTNEIIGNLLEVIGTMTDNNLRRMGDDFWPVPTYGDILFSVK